MLSSLASLIGPTLAAAGATLATRKAFHMGAEGLKGLGVPGAENAHRSIGQFLTGGHGNETSGAENRLIDRLSQKMRDLMGMAHRDERREGGGFAALAAKPEHFAALLAGKKTREQLQQQQQAGSGDRNSQAEETAKTTASTIGNVAMNFGRLGGAVGILAAVIGKMAISARGFGERRSEANREMSQFNAQIGDSFAQLGRQQTNLSLRTGQGTAGSVQWLNQERMRNNEAFQKWEQFFTNTGNNLAAMLTRGSTWIFEGVNAIFEKHGLERVADEAAKKKAGADPGAPQQPWRGLLRDVAAGQFTGIKEEREMRRRR